MWINDSKASTAEIEAGVRAASEVFKARGIDPATAYGAVLLQADGHDFDLTAAEAWCDAETAAFSAAFAGWQGWPINAVLVL